jgi:hypothetical protein
MNWFTVLDAKVSYFGFKAINAKGEEYAKWIRLGIRINMADGSWWFHHFKTSSWTRHWPLTQAINKQGKPATELGGKPIMLPEKKDQWGNWEKLAKEFGNRPKLLTALQEGVVMAYEAEAEKRAA